MTLHRFINLEALAQMLRPYSYKLELFYGGDCTTDYFAVAGWRISHWTTVPRSKGDGVKKMRMINRLPLAQNAHGFCEETLCRIRSPGIGSSSTASLGSQVGAVSGMSSKCSDAF